MSSGGSRYSTGAVNNGQNPFAPSSSPFASPDSPFASPASPFASQSSSFFSSSNPYNSDVYTGNYGFPYANNPYAGGANQAYIDMSGPKTTESGDAPQTGGLSYAGPQNTVTYSVESTPVSVNDTPTGGGKPAYDNPVVTYTATPDVVPGPQTTAPPTATQSSVRARNSYGASPPKFQGGLGSLQFYRP